MKLNCGKFEVHDGDMFWAACKSNTAKPHECAIVRFSGQLPCMDLSVTGGEWRAASNYEEIVLLTRLEKPTDVFRAFQESLTPEGVMK